MACVADWALAQSDMMGCRNSKVLPEPPGDVQLDLVKKVSIKEDEVAVVLVVSQCSHQEFSNRKPETMACVQKSLIFN